jgi:TnpA family transposase
LQIEEHYTDTAGFTDHVFALCHLLGFRFAPRLRFFGTRFTWSGLFKPCATAGR